MSETSRLCPKCGAPIPPTAPQGLCPKCLMSEVAATTVPGNETGQRATPPDIETLKPAFPQLEIVAFIGQGGMGFVYKARQPKLERFVALKILPASLSQDPAFAERFAREGRMLARLSHPNIVSIYDFGQADGFFYLLMEYVDGVNLRQAMRVSKFTPEQALTLVPSICGALQYAHDEGVLHRDIKPENILLDTKGRVKIADFGIAKLIGDVKGATGLTASGATLGTPHYMAPEQIEKPADVDHRADIYSLGVVFYELLTGELPLGRFAPPSAKTPVTALVDEVVLRALEKERERRQQSAGEMKTEVESAATGSPGGRSQPPSVPPKLFWTAREISAHMTDAERKEKTRHQLKFAGGVITFAWLLIFLPYFLPPHAAGPFFVGAFLTAVVFAFMALTVFLDRFKTFLGSTRWAQEQGVTHDRIRLFGGTLEFRIPPRSWIAGIAIIGALIALVLLNIKTEPASRMLTPNDFIAKLEAGMIQSATISYSPRSPLQDIRGYYYETGARVAIVPFHTRMALNEKMVDKLMSLPNFDIRAPNQVFLSFIRSLLPILLILAIVALICFFLIRRSRGVSRDQVSGNPWPRRIFLLVVAFLFLPVLLLFGVFLSYRFARTSRFNAAPAYESQRLPESSAKFLPEPIVDTVSPLTASKTIVLTGARATNQLIDSYNVLTVGVKTETLLVPGETLVPLVKQADGRITEVHKSVFVRRTEGSNQAATSTAFTWSFQNSFGNEEAEAAVRQLEQRFADRPLILLDGSSIELFSVTNRFGGTLTAYLEFRRSLPDLSPANVQATVNIRSYSTFPPALTYSAKALPAGYALQAFSTIGEANTSIIGREYRTTWFQPGDSKPGLPARQLQERSVTETQFEALIRENPIQIAPGEPRMVFSITNNTGELFQGFLELVGPPMEANQ